MASVTKTGEKSWRVLVRVKGHAAVCRTFDSEEKAAKFGAATERRIRGGATVATKTITVGEAVAKFREFRDRGTRPIDRASTEHFYLSHLADGLGDIEVDKLTPKRLMHWCSLRAEDGAGPSTLNSEISKLGTVLKFVGMSMNTVFPDIVGTARPLLEYSNLIGPSRSRNRRPTAGELERLSSVLSPAMWDVAQFAIGTAMRRGEIVRIQWADIDEARRCVLVRDRKHPKKKVGNHMVVPVTALTGIDAWSIMLRQPRIDERVFPFSTEFISDSFGAARDALGIEDLHFHDLRHEATSRLFEAGLMIQQVAVITGHKNWRNLERYTHIRPETLRAPGSHPGTPQRLDSLRIADPGPRTSEA